MTSCKFSTVAVNSKPLLRPSKLDCTLVERETEREKERARECERERVCVHSCMHKVTRGTQVKGTKRMKTQVALRVHEEDVAVRHEGLQLHANA